MRWWEICLVLVLAVVIAPSAAQTSEQPARDCPYQPCHEHAHCGPYDLCTCNEGYIGDGVYTCADMCTCHVRGDPLVEAFDPTLCVLYGSYKYLLSKHTVPTDACAHTIHMKTGTPTGYDGMTYPISVDVEIMDVKIRVEPNFLVLIGGEQVDLPLMDHVPGLSVYRRDSAVVVDAECGVKLDFFAGEGADSLLTLQVPTNFSNLMTGLCGNCNGVLDEERIGAMRLFAGEGRFKHRCNNFIVDETDDGIEYTGN